MTAYAHAEKGAPTHRMRRKLLPHSCDSEASGMKTPINSLAKTRQAVIQIEEIIIEMPADMYAVCLMRFLFPEAKL